MFIQDIRSKVCIPEEHCNMQLAHSYSGYRFLTFCDKGKKNSEGNDVIEEQLSNEVDINTVYYNSGVSDP